MVCIQRRHGPKAADLAAQACVREQLFGGDGRRPHAGRRQDAVADQGRRVQSARVQSVPFIGGARRGGADFVR